MVKLSIIIYDNLGEIHMNLSDRKELVDAIVNLAAVGNVTAFGLDEFLSGIIGIAV